MDDFVSNNRSSDLFGEIMDLMGALWILQKILNYKNRI